MENATKSLLIAAAILIILIIISTGIVIVREGQEVIANADMSEAQRLAHNSKFTNYDGDSVSASKVNKLLDIVLAHNQQSEESEKVQITGNTGAAVDITNGVKKVITTEYYKVHFFMENGIIKKIEIKYRDGVPPS